MCRHLSFCTACLALLAAGLLLLSAPAAAATTELRIFLDLDNNPATGCDVAVPPLGGVEQILLTTVETSPPLANVTAITRQECIDPGTDTFGPPVAVDPGLLGASLPYPVGIGNGLDGTHVVETFLPLSALPPGLTVVRLGVLATDDAGGTDVLVTATPGGTDPILLPLEGLLIEIPTLSVGGLLLLGLLLAAAALALLRRRSTASVLLALVLLGAAGAAWAACVLDGEVDDWTGVPPLAEDGLADGPPGADLRALFGNQEFDAICFRVDLALVLNQPPAADPQMAATEEDLSVTITLTGSDPDGDALSFAVATPPASGSLGAITPIDATSAQVTYIPNPNFNGADSFTFTVNDGTVDSVPATVDITVNPANDPPVADPQTAATDEDVPVVITLTGSDLDGEALSFAVATGPTSGSLGAITPIDATSAQVTYTPNPGFNGADSFTFTVNDGTVDSTPATVDITVNPVNDPPVADPQMAATDEDVPVVITLTGSDLDGDPLTFAVATGPANGSLGAITPIDATSSQVTYTPNLNFNGADNFTFTVNDGTVDSAAATVDITVNALNDPPVANPQMVATDEDVAVVITLTGSDTDGDALSFAVATGPTSGSLGAITPIDATSAQVTYTPNLNFNGADSFTFTVNDGTVDSAAATVDITVNPVNDPPVAVDDSYTTVGNTELTGGGATPTSLARVVDATNPLGNDSDPVEGTALTVVAAAGDSVGPSPFVGTSALGGDVTMNADGSFVYVPPVGVKNRLGGSADTFQYTIEDAGGAQATATVAIEIVDEIVWYLHNDPAGEVLNPVGGDGRSNDPFDKLSDADAVADDPEDASAPGDTIFVFRGDGTTANQSLGITLTSGQKLLGHRSATLLRGGVTIQTPAPGAHPKIEHTAGDGVTVLANAGNGDRSGIEIRGLDITGDDNAIDISAVDAANLDVALTDNLLTSTNGASLVVDGSGSTGTAVVRELATTNVLTAGAGGGHVFESVTFDADVTAAGIQPVAAGNVDVGNPASPGDVAGHGVWLNNVRGILDFGALNIGNSGGVGLFVRDADGKAGTFVLDTDSGAISTVNGPAVDLDPVGLGLGGLDGMVLTSVTVNVTAGIVPHGINLDTVAGSFEVTGATSISAGGIGTLTTGINAVNATAAITFTGTTTISSTTGVGIGMSNVDGDFTVASMTSSVTGAGGAAIDIDQGLGDFTYNGSINNTAGRSLEITNHEGPGGGSTVSLTGPITDSGAGIFLDNNDQGAGGTVINLTGALNLTTGSSNAFTASNGGIVNVTDPANNNLAATTTGTAVTIADTSIGGSGVKFTTVNVNGAAAGILLTNVPSGNFTATGGAVQNVTNRGLDVQGGSGNVTVGTSLSTTATGRSLEVTGKMGGTVAVSGAIDDNGLGVNLDSNPGSTVTLTGSMDIDTVGANTGFNATGGGTVNVLTGTNDVDTSAGTGTAIHIANTTIGASGVTFRSASANGAAIGIHLDNAGTSGFFTVTGTGSTAGSGGTIQNTTQNGVLVQSTDHINLSNMNLFNASNDGGGAGSCSATVFTGCNAAVELATVVDVNLVNLAITGAEDHGIFGQTVTDLDISNTTVTGLGADVDTNEHGIFLRDLLGTVAGTTDSVFDTVTVDDAQDTAILIQNTIATNPGNTLNPDQVTVSNSVLTNAGDSGLNVQTVAPGGNLRLVATGNTVTNTVDGIDAEASAGNLQASVGGAGPLANGISAGAGGNMVNGILFFASAANGPAMVDATATNNLITLDAVKVGMPPVAPVSGLNGIGVSAGGASAANLGTIRATIQNNIINSSFSGVLTQTVHGVITTNEGTGTTSQNVISIDGNVITLDPPAGTTTAETVGIGVDGGTTGAGTTVRSTGNTILATGDASNGASVGIQILPTELGDPGGTGTRVCVRVTGNDVSTPNNPFAGPFLTTELDVIAAPVATGSFLDVEAIPVGARTTAQLKADLEPLNTNTEVGDPGAAVMGTITGVAACPN